NPGQFKRLGSQTPSGLVCEVALWEYLEPPGPHCVPEFSPVADFDHGWRRNFARTVKWDQGNLSLPANVHEIDPVCRGGAAGDGEKWPGGIDLSKRRHTRFSTFANPLAQVRP